MMMIFYILDWHRYGRLIFAYSVPLRTESVCVLLTTRIAFRCPFWHNASLQFIERRDKGLYEVPLSMSWLGLGWGQCWPTSISVVLCCC